MEMNKNGIRVVQKRKAIKREPLEHCLDNVLMKTLVDGIEVVLSVPYFKPVINELKKSGYKMVRE